MLTRTLSILSLFTVAACSGAPTSGQPDAAPPDAAPGADASADADAGSSSCSATSYPTADLFVSPSGADGAAGTSADPTTLVGVEAKIAALAPGRTMPIVVFLEDGTYAPWTLHVSGTAQAPVVFTAAPGAHPVISGGKAITGWTKTTINGVAAWRAPATGLAPFEQLWVDGVRRYRPTTTPGAYLYNANTTTTFTSFSFANSDVTNFYDLASVEIDAFENWTMPRMHVASVDPTQHVVTVVGSTNTTMFHGFMPQHRYLVENVKEALSQPGQWYLDRLAKEIDYVPASPTEDPNTESVIAPQSPTLLAAKNVSHVVLSGLTFSYANWTVPQQGWTDSQTESDPSANLPAAVSFDGASDVTVDSCVVSHVSQVGLEIVGAGSNNHVVRSAIGDTGGSGVRVGAWTTPNDTDATVQSSDVIEENVVSGVGRFLPSGNGIFVGNAHHIVVRHNEVFDTYTYAIDVGVTYGNRPDQYTNMGLAHDETIELNHVHQVGQGVTSDIGGIYTATGTQTGNVVQRNVVHDVVHDPGNPSANSPEGYGGWGIYNDASSSNVVWQSNLVYRCSQACMHFHYGQNATYRNNVFAFGGEAQLERSSAEHLFQMTFDGNIIYADHAGLVQRGDWTCPIGATTSCYTMKNNVYVTTNGTPTFTNQRVAQRLDQQQWPSLTFSQWQGLGQDPAPSTASFALSFGTADAPAFDLGASVPIPFTPFDPSQAGRTCTTLAPVSAPAGFPTQAWPAPF